MRKMRQVRIGELDRGYLVELFSMCNQISDQRAAASTLPEAFAIAASWLNPGSKEAKRDG